jgi:hypothetical protein
MRLILLNSIRKMLSYKKIQRVEGIEPSALAWKAKVLPLNYTRFLFL